MRRSTISRNQVLRALRFARPPLVGALGETGAAAVLNRMCAQYEALASTVPRLRAPMSRMTLRIAVDSLALYRSLPGEMPRADRLSLVERFVCRWMDGQFEKAPTRWVYRHRWTHLLLRRWWFGSANVLDEARGWRFRYLRPKPGLFYGVDVTRCGIARYLVDQGAPELAPVMCRGDFRIEKYLPEGVRFDRTQVIAEGAPYCDFRYHLTGGTRG